MNEGTEVKVNGPREVELFVTESGVPFTFLRPQYIYGYVQLHGLSCIVCMSDMMQ